MTNILEFKNSVLSTDDREIILNSIKQNHFVVLRGLVDRSSVRGKLDQIWNYACESEHLGSSGVAPEVIRRFSS